MPGSPVIHHLLEFAQTHVPLSRWCHLSISSSVVPFSSCLQSSPASGSFQMSQLFTSGGQSTGASDSASVLPMNIQDWFPLGWTGWISLQSKGLSRVFSNTTVQKHQFFSAQLCLWSNSHMTTGKTIALIIQTFVSKVMSLLFTMMPRFVIAFLPRSKHLLFNYRLNKCHVLVTQSCPTLCHPVDCSLPGSSVLSKQSSSDRVSAST